MKKALILGILAALLIVPTVVFAATTIGIMSGTKITFLGPNCNMNYTDSVLNPKAPVYGTNITAEVTSVYGFEPIVALGDQSVQPGKEQSYLYTLTNNANTSDAFYITDNVVFTNTNGHDWKIRVIVNGVTTLVTWDVTSAPCPLSKDGVEIVSVEVTPSTWEAWSPNGSSVEVTLNITTESNPTGYYFSPNTCTYGGLATSSDATVTLITTSAMKMTRYAVANAPILYSGGKHDPVPGAVITYVIVTSNEGDSNATNVIIVDKVPTQDVAAYHMGYNGLHDNVTIDAGLPTAYGWKGYYSKSTPPDLNFGVIGSDWITVDALNGATIDSAATYVKWEKVTVEPTEDAKTLTWGIIIK